MKQNNLLTQSWSMSKLKMLESCPLNFYLTYILKLKRDNVTQDTLARDLGLTMHYIFEMMMSGYTIKESYTLAEEEYLNIVSPDNWHHIKAMLPNVYKFNRMMHDRELEKPFEYVIPEQKLAIDRDFNPIEFDSSNAFFRGVIDYTARSLDNTSMILDFKKGGSDYLTKYHAPQLTAYTLLDYYANEKFDTATSYIYYIESGVLSPGPKLDGELIESHTRPWLENKINSAIIAVEDVGEFRHNRTSMCKYCNYEDLCKAKGHKRKSCGELIEYVEQSREIL